MRATRLRSIFLFSLLWILVLADYSTFSLKLKSRASGERYNKYKRVVETTHRPLIVKCGRYNKGICMQAVACPWERMLEDRGERCLEEDTNFVCCRVAQVRMPADLFEAYGV